MKELDVVKIIKDYEGIPSGTQGTIVCEYDGKAFEVEFFDDNGDTIDVVTTPAELLELVEEYASDLINKYSGKGTPVGIGKERVDFGKVIGYYVDKETGKNIQQQWVLFTLQKMENILCHQNLKILKENKSYVFFSKRAISYRNIL